MILKLFCEELYPFFEEGQQRYDAFNSPQSFLPFFVQFLTFKPFHFFRRTNRFSQTGCKYTGEPITAQNLLEIIHLGSAGCPAVKGFRHPFFFDPRSIPGQNQPPPGINHAAEPQNWPAYSPSLL